MKGFVFCMALMVAALACGVGLSHAQAYYPPDAPMPAPTPVNPPDPPPTPQPKIPGCDLIQRHDQGTMHYGNIRPC